MTYVLTKLSEKKPLLMGVAIAMLALGIAAIAYQMWTFGPSVPGIGMAYFTTDDGATLFEAPEDRIPPFEHDGKQAVRAVKMQCEGGKPFLAYFQRFTPWAQKTLIEWEKSKKNWKQGDPPPNWGGVEGARRGGLEYRLPGQSKWTSESPIVSIKCPDGTGSPLPYSP